jgi:hypothetical protein
LLTLAAAVLTMAQTMIITAMAESATMLVAMATTETAAVAVISGQNAKWQLVGDGIAAHNFCRAGSGHGGGGSDNGGDGNDGGTY